MIKMPKLDEDFSELRQAGLYDEYCFLNETECALGTSQFQGRSTRLFFALVKSQAD